MTVFRIHYSGGLRIHRPDTGRISTYARGYPVCVVGEQAFAIKRAGRQTDIAQQVTCATCRRLMALAREYDSISVPAAVTRTKYTISEVISSTIPGTRIFKVHARGAPEYRQTEVWFSHRYTNEAGPRAWCCSCSSIQSAMSGGCAHARAVLRYVKRQDTTVRTRFETALKARLIEYGPIPRTEAGLRVFKQLALDVLENLNAPEYQVEVAPLTEEDRRLRRNPSVRLTIGTLQK